MFDYFQLEGKTAIVTGAANGIGAGIAKMLAGLGANVVACDIEDEPLAKTVDSIKAEGGSISALHCDISCPEDVENSIKTAIDTYGALHILVNNAAGCGGGKKIDDMTDPEWDRLINLNLTCVYKFIMKVYPIFKAQHYGKIVNISSGAAITGDWSDPHYAAAKGGVISLGRELAVEFSKDHIFINTVAPGLVQTRMLLPWEGVEENNILVGRIGTPKDIAATVAFLASAASDYFTGQTICPNGGSWMY
ncbi:MAG: SDR family oxidoreductase [Firmicutes bacterium]|nr:SDR family oxidoreductase [Bacillota bacterium]